MSFINSVGITKAPWKVSVLKGQSGVFYLKGATRQEQEANRVLIEHAPLLLSAVNMLLTIELDDSVFREASVLVETIERLCAGDSGVGRVE